MRNRTVLGIAGTMALVPAMASATSKQPVRRVELISMTSVPAPAVDATTVGDAVPFREHDLSRRYVEFRMAQEFSVTPSFTKESPVRPGPATAPRIATLSAIVAPVWMRGGIVAPPPAFTPGCTPMAWRPSGFLDRATGGRRAAYYGMMSAIACEHGIPVGLFDAMILRESGYNSLAVSPKNAFGLAQLMPATAQGLGVDRYDPSQNLRGGARYLRQQLDRFGQFHLALAAYNAGPGRVRGKTVPAIPETRAYVSNILTNWTRISGASQSQTASTTLPIPISRTAASVLTF